MSHKWAASPYLVWMALFIVVPIILVGYWSLTVKTDAGTQLRLRISASF